MEYGISGMMSGYQRMGVGGGQGMGMGGRGGQMSLTEEQSQTLADILANYDAENMTEQDIESLREDLQEAGIQPGRGLGTALMEAGFDPQQLRPEGAGQGQGAGRQGPPPEAVEELTNILEMLTNEEDSDDAEAMTLLEEFIARMQEERPDQMTGLIVDQGA